jgi:hypothetical protein
MDQRMLGVLGIFSGRAPLALVVSVSLAAAACGGGDDDETNGNRTGSDGPLDFSDPSVPAGPFRYGINLGHRNTSWGDPLHAELAFDAGCSSMRNSLPERHLDRWGYDIELGDMAEYDAIGMGARVAFLTEPIRDHSMAPAAAEDWELAYYPPTNLYAPILQDDGSINPDNHWAAYVYETVSRYSPWIRVWEIWNEPDWVENWEYTQTWDTEPPTAEQLPHFNGSIYEYVRLLRVSMVAAKLADPDALIATGGLGYESFLAAVLRYTDNPEDGSVTDEYPQTGASYFDVLSFHHYPLYTEGNSDAAVDAYVAHRESFAAVLDAAGKDVIGWETTETGAPHRTIPDTASGESYARNYLLKVMTRAQVIGVDGVHWYTLSDYGENEPTDRNDGYEWMGLYEDIAALETTDQARHTPTGIAYATLGGLLRGAAYDATRSAELGLDGTVDGAAFALDDGRAALVLWARSDTDENGSTTFALASDATWQAYAWDGSLSDEAQTLTPTAGALTLDLTSSPSILIEQ